ncbi:MAG: FtsQ-type POTRA domain-containing protein [Geminocystis sp.]|nr:FtsQ-type POTRA domain-containing protein [Geminocystis sp.]MCX8077503.1 FtsQ-type POTRA domain-containing protein [Geminocystis sp.]MDW8462965.1 FtsQ-type POTRA domain-containing protein [Geminocystis sp.]
MRQEKAMIYPNVISTTELKNRRKLLERERRIRRLTSLFRFGAILGFVTTTFWYTTLPHWVIRDSKQIEIEGNELMTVEEIRGLIPLRYPQSILKLSPQKLARDIKRKMPVEDVVVIKEFQPPRLKIRLKEKPPVAVAFSPKISPKTQQITFEKTGYLDADGVFVDKKFYQNLEKHKEKIPQLKIIGWPQTYLPYWQEIYYMVEQSSVKINTIDWRNPANMVLLTEIGTVYIGPYTSKFPEQLMVLEKMKTITGKIPREKIVYIDLMAPEIPSIKEKKEEEKSFNKYAGS